MWPFFFSFERRVSPTLSFSGRLCTGEEIDVADVRTFQCESNLQWIVEVDDSNFCTPESCTDFDVPSVIAQVKIT